MIPDVIFPVSKINNIDDVRNKIVKGDALENLKLFPDKSIEMAITSPPYLQKRVYKEGAKVWDADLQCEHDWVQIKKKRHNGRGDAQKSAKYSDQKPVPDMVIVEEYCRKCPAYKCELGQEDVVWRYVKHLCDIFDQVKRVLKDSGSLYVNIGDSKDKKNGDMNIPLIFAEEMKKRGWLQKRDIIWRKKNAMPNSDLRNYTIDYEHVFFFVKSQKKYYFNTQYQPYSEATLKEIQKAYTGKGKKDYEEEGIQNPSDAKRRIIKSVLANTGANDKEPYQRNNPHRMRIDGTNAEIGEEVATTIKFGGEKAEGYGNPIYSGNEWKASAKGSIKRSVWDITTKGIGYKHYASFPWDLVMTPVLASCPEFICSTCGAPTITNYVMSEVFTRPGKDKKEGVKNCTEEDPYSKIHGSEYYKQRPIPVRMEDGVKPTCSCFTTPKKGIVLDIFAGTGTSGIVAHELNRDFINMEIAQDYIDIQKERFKKHETKPLIKISK